MGQIERESKGNTEDAQEVVKGGDNEASAADLRREAAVAAQNQADAEQPAGEPPFVVDNPLPGGGDGPRVVTEVQSLAPEHGTSPPLLVPADDDDQDEDDAPDADEDAASKFRAGPDPASREPLAADAGEGSYQDGDDLLLQTEPSRLAGDEPIPGFIAPAGSGGGANPMIDGDPDRPILMEAPTGNLTTDGDLDRGPVTLNADRLGNFEIQDFSERDDPEDLTVEGLSLTGESILDSSGEHPLELVLGVDEFQQEQMYLHSADEAMESGDDLQSETVLEGAEPLEFIIGDGGPMRPGWLSSGEDDTNAGTPEILSTGAIGEQPLEFTLTSGMDAETVAKEAVSEGDNLDFALGGPDTATRLVGLPEVPNVADAFPESDPLGMTKADVISEISVEPLSYEQADTMTSSLDDDDDDPLDGP